MDVLQFLVDRYQIDLSRRSPIEIPNVGRNTLAQWFGELGFKEVAEVGVEQGKFSEVLCKANPKGKLYCVDLWETYSGYRDYLNQEFIHDAQKIAQQRLAGFRTQFVKAFSMDAVKQFKDESLDAVYIDANHEFKWVVEDIFEWSRKVKRGGIISGHDFYESAVERSRCHVIPAVMGYTQAYKISPWFILGTKAKNPGEIRDTSRSWMWVKK